MNSIFGIIIACWEDKVRNENQSINFVFEKSCYYYESRASILVHFCSFMIDVYSLQKFVLILFVEDRFQFHLHKKTFLFSFILQKKWTKI